MCVDGACLYGLLCLIFCGLLFILYFVKVVCSQLNSRAADCLFVYMDILQYSDEIEAAGEIDTFVSICHSNIPLAPVGSLIKIIHLNIRSISKNFDSFSVLLESLKQDFEIIILTETWNIDNIDIYNISGYNSCYSQGKYNRNDGVVVFVKDTINAVFSSKIYTENTFTLLDFKTDSYSFCIVAVYRLPSTNAIEFIDEFINIVNLIDKSKICIFVGDINIDIFNTNDYVANKYLNVMAENGFLNFINKPTRVTVTSKTTLDHIFVRNPFKKNLLFTPIVLQSDITDHFAVVLQISHINLLINKTSKPADTVIQDSTVIDYHLLRSKLLLESWTTVYAQTDPNIAYIVFFKHFNVISFALEKK